MKTLLWESISWNFTDHFDISSRKIICVYNFLNCNLQKAFQPFKTNIMFLGE